LLPGLSCIYPALALRSAMFKEALDPFGGN
jgi:hypothetical protein